ncbi:MAG TPA: 4-hydroxythreonine-4-phosphate dehydrogenase PdxA [Bacteroidota bacterium]|nr:4-hydroxythreonine-4-phosphate dehydrogenase PdxA [Bacteroidota bacterium]
MKPIVAITAGDYNGIGPEVALKAASLPGVRRSCTPLLVGPARVFERMAERLTLPLRFRRWDEGQSPAPGEIPLLDTAHGAPVRVAPGKLSAEAGASAARAIEAAVDAVMRGGASAVVTAPVSKQALHLAGVDTPGQTELLQRLTHAPHVAMMLVAGALRVGLVTIHTPLRDVPRELTGALLLERVRVIHRALRTDWGIASPRIALLGLNPHAGEGGDIGNEEQRVIIPAMETLRKERIALAGPFPADAFFSRYRPEAYDAVVAMYHDQGLIPLKMAARGTAVNVSVGLPVVRTSPDHGTAFDIARRLEADPSSMVNAIAAAVAIAARRGRGGRP